jgi:hypothetical protein
MKAAKKFGKIVLIIVVLVIVAILLLPVYGKGLIKNGIEVGATSALQTDVTIGGLDFSLFGGSAQVQNLVVDNLPDYKEDTLLTLGDIKVDVGIKSLMSDPVHIEHIILDGMSVTLEQKGLTNNIEDLVKSLPSGDPDAPKEPEEEDEGPSKQLVIDKLDIRNVQVTVKPFREFSGTTLKLNPIVMEDLGASEPMDMASLTGKIMLAIIGGIAEQGSGLIPDDLVNGLGDSLGSAGEAAKEALKETGKALDGLKDVGKGLDGLFKKKEE